jgi:hypothetical protein
VENTVDVSSVSPSAEFVNVLKNLCAEPFGELNYDNKRGIKQM